MVFKQTKEREFEREVKKWTSEDWRKWRTLVWEDEEYADE